MSAGWSCWHGPTCSGTGHSCGAPVTSVEPGCTCGGTAACQQCQERDAGLAHEVEATPTPDGTMYACRVCGYWGLSVPSVPCTGSRGMRLSRPEDQADFDTLKSTLNDHLDIGSRAAAQDCASALWFAGFRVVIRPEQATP